MLKQIHEGLDAAVFAAYGWPGTLSDEGILERLVALNHERAAEEAAGKIRWLRPEFQNPQTGEPKKTQQSFDEADEDEDDSDDSPKAKGKKKPPPSPPRPLKPIGEPRVPNATEPSGKPSPHTPSPPQMPTSRTSSPEPCNPFPAPTNRGEVHPPLKQTKNIMAKIASSKFSTAKKKSA